MKRISDNRCEVCKVWYRHADKKWCSRCIDQYRRKQALTPKGIEKTVLELVEARYINATTDDIERQMLKKLLNRKADQDVFLFGLAGRGKTHIMAALIRDFISKGYECIRISFDDFCCKVRSTMSPVSKQTEWDMMCPLKDVDMLFIDDLGLRSKQESDFAYGTLYSILNKRQERLLPTFISSNKNLTRIREAFDERIISRLQTALIIEITGEDRRVKGK